MMIPMTGERHEAVNLTAETCGGFRYHRRGWMPTEPEAFAAAMILDAFRHIDRVPD